MEIAVSARRLSKKPVARVWGRAEVAGLFPDYSERDPIGEIWFEDPAGAEAALLVKTLFTSERLSIQVHPGDDAARARGHRRGKDEAWYVLSADPGAVIGIGLVEAVSQERLRAAALDGAIETLLDWRPVAVGDVFYVPAGTIHAIGAGLSLVEVQQNVDLTYRLYDYGRPRELHLDDGVAVADPKPYSGPEPAYQAGPGREVVAAGAAFVLERWSAQPAGRLNAARERPITLVPIRDGGTVAGQPLDEGDVWIVDGPEQLCLTDESSLLVAYPGGDVALDLIG